MYRKLTFVWLLLMVVFTDLSAQEDYTLRHSIYFPGGRAYITQDQLVRLKQLVDSLYDHAQYEITIHSHTDNIGGVAYNQWLSEMRSLTTKTQLENFGLDEHSIHIKDFGQHNPVYDNNTQRGRELNRRVDIIFWPLSL